MKTSDNSLTPMMKQFFGVKAQHPEALLLFRCGDFFETYGDDAVTASKILGIVLTKRSNGNTCADMPMAGFPHHALDVYLPKLVRAGYKVAVCDQLEDPKLTKNIVKRGITELVTPGIAFNENLLEQKENNFLAGLCFEKDRCGAAFLDVSTGTFQVAEGSLDYIATLLASFAPKEVLVRRGYERGVRERFGDHLYLSTLEDWAFVYDSSQERLCKQLGVESLKGFGIAAFPLGVCAAGALLVYLEQTQHAGLGNICSIGRIDEGKFVWMDRFTLRNLEIFTSASGSEGVSLVDVVDRCSSPMGSRLLRSYLAMPVMDPVELDSRYDVVGHFVKEKEDLAAVQGFIGNIGDLERIISRAAAGKIMPREVMQLGRGLAQMDPISSLCLGKGVQALDDMMAQLSDCSALLETITRTMAADPASALGKGDIIASGVSDELDSLRDIARHGKEILLDIQQRETQRTGISSLKISFNSVFGYYLEVRNTFKDKVPPEWIRKQTLVNAERYITPELKEYEEKILGAEEKIYLIESQLYAALVATIQKNIAAIQSNCRVIARLDVLSSFAELAVSNRYCRPVVNDGFAIDIRKGRHPLLDQAKAVPVDVQLGEDFDTLVITGPNTGGKTVSLKTIGLLSAMNQCGLHIPAGDGSTLPVFTRIFADIGDEQSIEQSLSTFSSHMKNIVSILEECDDRSLVLFDELGAGTDPTEGAALAISIIERVRKAGSLVAATTHYAELKVYATNEPRVQNASCEFDVATLKPTYKLLIGIPGKSNAFAISKRLGLSDQVINDAKNRISTETADFEATIEKLEQTRTALERDRDEAERQLKKAQDEAKKAAFLRAELEVRLEKADTKSKREAEQIIRDARAQAEQVFAELDDMRRKANDEQSAQELNAARTELRHKLNKFTDDLQTSRPSEMQAEDDSHIPVSPGDSVTLKSMGIQAEVVSVEADGTYQLRAGIMNLKAKRDEFTVSKSGAAKKKAKPAASTTTLRAAAMPTSVDLRGMESLEAIAVAEQFIDSAVMAKLQQITIVHGKGTGALRNAVAQMLRHNKCVKSFRLGRYGEGETGVTVVELK